MRAIEHGADVATVRRIYALPGARARPLLHEPRLLLAGAPGARPALPRHRDRLQVLPAGRVLPLLDEIEDGGWFWDTEFMARADAPRAEGGRDPGRLRAPRGQDLDRPGPARLGPLLPPAPGASGARSRRRTPVKALVRDRVARRPRAFGFSTLAMLPYRVALLPQLRAPWLRLLGARASGGGRSSTTCASSTCTGAGSPASRSATSASSATSACSTSPRASASSGRSRFAERVLVLTHTNVGYADHPLQPHFPALAAPVVVERGRLRRART
ncbi:MAG: hypothetical protein M0C28_28035 [Candidatus Moduliflexus flocculans]|nr:hypothetical protein [Candidatus Moduliflexus flocculans]